MPEAAVSAFGIVTVAKRRFRLKAASELKVVSEEAALHVPNSDLALLDTLEAREAVDPQVHGNGSIGREW
jgi:hypothetical protein